MNEEVLENVKTESIEMVGNSGQTHVVESVESKICKTCGNNLPISSFALRKRFSGNGTTYYREGSCKKCVNQKKKDYINSLPEDKKQEYLERRRLASKNRKINLTPEQIEERKLQRKSYKEQLPDWKKNEQKLMADIRVKENKRKWIKWKEQEGCFHCHGENLGKESSLFGEAYDSHHVHQDKKKDSSGKTVEISRMVSGGYTWSQIEVELRKTVTLCKYCHSQWHAKNLFIDFSKWSNYNSNLPLMI